MAVNHGSKIAVGDLKSLADFANTKVGSHRLSNDVLTMYYDGTEKYGYRKLNNVKISTTARGSGYKPGDILSGPAGSSFEISKVDASGRLVGLRIISSGVLGVPPVNIPPDTPDPVSPQGLSGGSGSGAQITFDFAHVGPGMAYSFDDYKIGHGFIHDFVLTNTGSGYTAGDELALPGYSGTINVDSVDGSGAIVDWTYLITVDPDGEIPIGIDYNEAVGGSGSGAVFCGLFMQPEMPSWKDELHRMRYWLNSYLTNRYDFSKLSVSGPWPISGPQWYYRDQWFYFKDTGGLVTVTAAQNVSGGMSYGRWETTYVAFDSYEDQTGDGWFRSDGHGGVIVGYSETPHIETHGPLTVTPNPYTPEVQYYAFLNVKKFDAEFIVGGTKPMMMTGVLYIQPQVVRGKTVHTYTPSPGSGVVVDTTLDSPNLAASMVSVSGNFPGTADVRVVYNSIVGGNPALQIFWNVNQMVAPGRYKAEITIAVRGSDTRTTKRHIDSKTDSAGNRSPDPYTTTYDELYVQNTRIGVFMSSSGVGGLSACGSVTWGSQNPDGTYSSAGFSGTLSFGATYSAAIPAEGICNDTAVKKISLEDLDAGGLPSALYGVQKLMTPLVFIPTEEDKITTQPGEVADGTSTGATQSSYYYPWTAWAWYPKIPQPTFPYELIYAVGTWSITTSTPGLWTGVCHPVNDPRAVTPDRMAWNLKRTHSKGESIEYQENPMLWGGLNIDEISPSNSYDQDEVVEKQFQLPRWKEYTYFTGGFRILTPNNTAIMECITPGYTGGTMPDWDYTPGANTLEPKYPYPLDDVPEGATRTWAAWRCIKLLSQSIVPSVARQNPYPRYPVYWENEPLDRLKPPTTNQETERTIWGCGSQWFHSSFIRHASGGVSYTVYEAGWQELFTYNDGAGPHTIGNLAYGWFIYAVSITRIRSFPANLGGNDMLGAGDNVGAGDGDAGAGPSGEIEVTIGCMRNGAFVAFGTYTTGQTIRVLWPIFTSDALVYQATERVEVQALALTGGVTVGLTGISHPICAAHVNDTRQLLNLVNPYP